MVRTHVISVDNAEMASAIGLALQTAYDQSHYSFSTWHEDSEYAVYLVSKESMRVGFVANVRAFARGCYFMRKQTLE